MRRLVYKILLIVAGKEATRVYGTDQLSSELLAGVEGGIHHIRYMWNAHVDYEEAGVILMIAVRNTFNEGNRKMMV